MLCDGIIDCADGEDEDGCAHFLCSGALRCRHDNICIHPINVCDGVVQCILSEDDESLCDILECPNACVCRGAIVMCVEHLPHVSLLSQSTRALVYSNVSFPNLFTLDTLIHLFHINIHDCNFPLRVLKKNIFAKLRSIHTLLLVGNGIQLIDEHTFDDMSKLMFLDVSDNMIQLIQEFTFKGIHMMSSIDLSSQFIASFDERSLNGLTELLTLNLSTNLLTRLESSSFIGIPKIQDIDLRNNPIQFIAFDTFYVLKADVSIHFTKSVYCCYLISVKSCHLYEEMQFNRTKCFDMSNQLTSVMHVVFSVLVILLTVVCVVSMQRSKLYQSQVTLLQNLSCFSSLPAVYVVCFKIHAYVLYNNFIFFAFGWRSSYNCLILDLLISTGFLLSKFTVFLIVVNQLFVTKYIFVRVPLSRVQILYSSSFFFFVNVVIAVLHSSHQIDSTLCFPFVVTNNGSTTHLVYVSWLLIVTLLFKLTILYMYREIYITIKASDAGTKTYRTRQIMKSTIFIRRAISVLGMEVLTWLLSLCLVLYNIVASDASSQGLPLVILMIYTTGYGHNLLHIAPRIASKVHALRASWRY